jgi:hypothetical protein
MAEEVNALDKLVSKFGVRKPYKGELDFFKKRPEVAGMATEDNKIILNPFSKNSPEEQQAVARNEALRLYMKLGNIQPDFELTKEQQKFFSGTEYKNDPLNAKRTTLARILTGDPSAGQITPEQSDAAKQIFSNINLSDKVPVQDGYKKGGQTSFI